MTDHIARIADAEAAEVAWERWVGPAVSVIRADYLAKLADLGARPMEGKVLAGVQSLSHALKVLTEVEGQLKAVIADGKVAQQDAQRASAIANMSPEARRWATM